MAIRILPESEIKKTADGITTPPLLFANPTNLYQRRAKRLRQLAEQSPLQDYLLFAANIVDTQLSLLKTQPIVIDSRLATPHLSVEKLADKPLNVTVWQRDPVWIELLKQILTQAKTFCDETALLTIDSLEKSATSELEMLADALLAQDFHRVSSDKAVFLWAALNLYWLQLAQQIPHNAVAELGGENHCCPVCGSAPVTSVVHFGTTQGLRYLHCALCESEWHMVRSKCSNCEQTGKLDYWSLDSENAPVKAESCGDCGSYLKVVYQEKDPNVEPVADDLASLLLDAEMEQKNFARSGVNPFLFPVE